MPSRNIVREFGEHEYYHVYNRGVEKRKIFLDERDYIVFLGLLKKYLGTEKPETKKLPRNANRHRPDKLIGEVEVLSYCLMPNHFHLLLYQTSKDGVHKLLRRVATSYSMYFNGRYNRVGSLFQGPYKASRITRDGYLQHISRYIHLNPNEYQTWPFSSLRYYRGDKQPPSWLKVEKILQLFYDRKEYLDFVDDYVAVRNELQTLKFQLANDLEKGEE